MIAGIIPALGPNWARPKKDVRVNLARYINGDELILSLFLGSLSLLCLKFVVFRPASLFRLSQTFFSAAFALDAAGNMSRSWSYKHLVWSFIGTLSMTNVRKYSECSWLSFYSFRFLFPHYVFILCAWAFFCFIATEGILNFFVLN